MSRTLVVFRKDVRRFRLELTSWAVLMGIYSWMHAVAPARPAWLLGMGLWELLLIPAACYLIVAVIHEELLVGDQQDWLTKPIPASSVLTAKLLFLATFIELPIALSQLAGLLANGLSLREFASVLLWRQAIVTAVIVGPVAALAAVTRSFGQFAVTMLCAYSGVLLLGVGAASATEQDPRWGGISWLFTAMVGVLAATASTVSLVFGYRLRQIWTSRVVLMGGILACGLLPVLRLWHIAFKIQMLLDPRAAATASVRISFDGARETVRKHVVVSDADPPGSVRVAIPIALTGIPVDMEVISDRSETIVDVGGGPTWRSGWRGGDGIVRQPEGWWHAFTLDRALFTRIRDRNVHLRSRTAFTLFGPAIASRLSVPAANRFVHDVGFCSVTPSQLICLSPFRHAPLVRTLSRSCETGSLSDLGIRPDVSYARYASDLGLRIWKTDVDGMLFPGVLGCELVIETRDVVAQFERDLDIPSICLRPFRDSPGAVR